MSAPPRAPSDASADACRWSARLAVVRAVTFGYAAAWLLIRGRYVWDVTRLPDRRYQPIGVLAWFDGRPSQALVVAVALGTLTASILAAAGRRAAVAAPAAALGMLIVATYTSSFGQIFHTEHLLVVHLVVLAVHAVASRSADDTRWTARWALATLAAATAATYVVAGVAKLRMSGLAWITGDALRNWVATDNLRKLLLEDPYSRAGGELAGVSWVWTPIAVATLAVELGAPVILLSWWGGRRGRFVAAGWAAAAWGFHVGVLALMAISFPYQLSGVAYAFVLPVERLAPVGLAVLRRLRPYTRAAWERSW